jgi:hypothetical protein
VEEKAKADATLKVTEVEEKATAEATQMKATANAAGAKATAKAAAAKATADAADAKATAEAAAAKATADAADAKATVGAAVVTTDETKAAELTKATEVSKLMSVRVKETSCLAAFLLLLVSVWIIFSSSHHSEAPTTVEIVFHRAKEAWKCVLQRRIDRMLGMERSSDVAGDGPEALHFVQTDHKDTIPPEPPPLPLSRALRLPVKEQKDIRPHTPEELQAYLKRLWALHDQPYSALPLAAEQYMVDRGASLTFVRRI